MENAGYELERLYTDVTSLCSRIELLPCSTARDRLAQSGNSSTVLNFIIHPAAREKSETAAAGFTNCRQEAVSSVARWSEL